MQKQQQVAQKCVELFAKVRELFGLNVYDTAIQFDLKGHDAGQAYRKSGVYGMRFNNDMLSRTFDHIMNDTVPHEIAHIVCFMEPKLGKGHDTGWVSICKELGGSGDQTHTQEVVYSKGHTYEYVTAQGKRVRVSQHLHFKIQSGSAYYYEDAGTVNKKCVYFIVASQGCTLQQPVAAVEHAVSQNQSKAATTRGIMRMGLNASMPYEEIITRIMVATGHTRQLARATYKANYIAVETSLQEQSDQIYKT